MKSRVLDLVSIVLLMISILVCFNIPFLGSMVAYPFLGTIFLLHFKPSLKIFLRTNIVLFMGLIILVFLLSVLNTWVIPFKEGILLWTEVWRCISLLAIFLCNLYIITERKIFLNKSLYLLICFVAPFLLASKILYICTVERLILDSFMSSDSRLNIQFCVSVILLVIATSFSYYSFLKLKRNILIHKAESQRLC